MDTLLLVTAVFFGLLFLGVPVAFTMLLTAAVIIFGVDHSISPLIIASRSVSLLSESFSFIAVPLFVLSARLLNAIGLTQRLVAFAVAAVGSIRGGLGHAVIVANLIAAGTSGSAAADAAGIGSIMIPSLKKAGYPAANAAALSAAAATLGPIFPPSIAMVIYSSLSGVSLGRMLLGGIVPALVIVVFMMIDLAISPTAATLARVPFNWKRLLTTGKDAILAILMPVIILGGTFGGVYTPTEGASVAVLYALLLGFVVYRNLTIPAVLSELKESAALVGSLSLIVMGANVLSWLLNVRGTGEVLASIFLPFDLPPGPTLIIVAAVTLILGTAMEEVTMLVLMTPILAPVVAQAGIDPVQFGVVFVLATMIGLITWPVGITMFITSDLAGVSTGQFARAVLRPLAALVAVVIVAAMVPEIVTWLPNLVMGKPLS